MYVEAVYIAFAQGGLADIIAAENTPSCIGHKAYEGGVPHVAHTHRIAVGTGVGIG